LQIDLPGAKHEASIDSKGRLKTGVELSSADGKISLSLKEGTVVLDKDESPLQLIQAAVDPTLPLPPEGAYIVGAVYDLRPHGATFNPSLKLTLNYDLDELPEGVRESEVYIAPYSEGTGWGMLHYKRIDTEIHTVTTQVDYFAKYAVLAPRESPKSPPQPSPQPDLTSVPLGQALSSGKPTLAEFGWRTCIPCKQMKPILEELAMEYEGTLNVVIVEVYEQMELARAHKIMAIPTQIFFDGNGKEVTRHMGFWAKKDIITQLKKMGVD